MASFPAGEAVSEHVPYWHFLAQSPSLEIESIRGNGARNACWYIVTNRVFGEAKNTNFLKFFLQCMKHVDARSNKEQFINKLLHTYSVACRSLPEFLIWFRVLCWRAQVRSESF